MSRRFGLVLGVTALAVLASPLVAVATPSAVHAAPSAQSVALGAAAVAAEPSGGFTSISCLSSSWCRTGGKHGVVWQWDGRAWTRGPSFGTANTELTDMTCTSTVFCMVGIDTLLDEANGLKGVAVYNGYSWRVIEGPGISSFRSGALSCTYHGFCMELIGSETKTYRVWNGTAWSARHPLPGLDFQVLTDLDCYSSRLCRAITYDGKIDYWDGRTWATRTGFLQTSLSGIDCPTATFCALVLGNGRAYVSHNGTFGGATNVGAPFRAVSCSSDIFCVAVAADGRAAVYRGSGTGWSSPTTVRSGEDLVDVSCPRSFSCHAVAADGTVFRRGSMGWVKTIVVDPLHG